MQDTLQCLLWCPLFAGGSESWLSSCPLAANDSRAQHMCWNECAVSCTSAPVRPGSVCSAAGTTTSTVPSWAPSASPRRAACRSPSGRTRCAVSRAAQCRSATQQSRLWPCVRSYACRGPLVSFQRLMMRCEHALSQFVLSPAPHRPMISYYSADCAGDEAGWRCAG